MNVIKNTVIIALAVLVITTVSHAGTVYFAMSTDDEIYSAPTDGSATPTLVVSPATGDSIGPVGFDIDFGNGLIYINDGNARYTYVQPLDGSGAPTALTNSNPPGGEHFALVLGLPNDRYFFTTDETDGLWVANTDGTGSATQIASEGVRNFHGMDYDPTTDRLYVGTTDGDDEIWRFNADGTGGTLLFDSSDDVTGARGVALDVAGGRIYWAQHEGTSGTGKILSGAIDGSGTPSVLYESDSNNAVFPADLEVFGGRLFWSEFDNDNDTSEILSAVIGGGGTSLETPIVLYDGLGEKIRGIRVVNTPVPVLSTLLLLGSGLIGLAGFRRRFSKR